MERCQDELFRSAVTPVTQASGPGYSATVRNMTSEPVIIEVAINGGTTKERNPNVPRTPDEIATDALACFEAGAAIIHNHIDLTGISEDEAAERYLEAWRVVLAERPDALWYQIGRAHV